MIAFDKRERAVPDPETDVEMPVEDAVEQERLVVPAPADSNAATGPNAAEEPTLEADEADYAEQQSMVGYDDDDYR